MKSGTLVYLLLLISSSLIIASPCTDQCDFTYNDCTQDSKNAHKNKADEENQDNDAYDNDIHDCNAQLKQCYETCN